MENWGVGRWIGATFASLIALFGVIVLLHGVVYGEWQLNWWYQTQNVNRQTNLDFHSTAYQNALRTQIQQGINQVDKDTSDIVSAQTQGFTAYANSLKPARDQTANAVCGQIAQLTNPGSEPAFTSWGGINCQNGVLSASSKYYYSGG